MDIILAKSHDAIKALYIVGHLQRRFVTKLNALSEEFGQNKAYEEISWLRDNGLHGGGNRFESRDFTLFNTGSVNVSQVHYEEMEQKNLKSATAISTIIHPKNPNLPSIHIHISYTELRDGNSYWRIMADLNPSIYNEEDKTRFERALKDLAKENFEEGVKQGDKYFHIPTLERTRGVSHFYLENYNTGSRDKDFAFAESFGNSVIDTYIDILTDAIKSRTTVLDSQRQEQLDYHTLYLFQVLTLDRGTTAGVLVHSQNDIGIMGSLPSYVNKPLLNSWVQKMQTPQDALLTKLIDVIDDNGVIDIPTKERLANVLREHYDLYPEALSMQASGDTIPTTVSNHLS